MEELKTTICGIKFNSPIMSASGTFGFGEEFKALVNLNKIGAIVTKGLSIKPIYGNPPPRICEVTGGIINSIGLQNDGIDNFIQNIYPKISKFSTHIIPNIFGYNVDEYVAVLKKINGLSKIKLAEVNLSCPNVKRGGMSFGTKPQTVFDLTRVLKSASNKKLIIKLSPNVTDIVEIAKAVEEAGADALTVANTFLAMAIDIKTKKPLLGNTMGGLSGPAIKPIILRMVHQTAKAVRIPIIACGGISNWRDVVEFLIVGASAIQIGTANFTNPSAMNQITSDLKKYLVQNKVSSINKLRNTLII